MGIIAFTRGRTFMANGAVAQGAFDLYLAGVFDEGTLEEIEREDILASFVTYHDQFEKDTERAWDYYTMGISHAECHDILNERGFFTEEEAEGYYNFFFGKDEEEKDEGGLKCQHCSCSQSLREDNFSILTSIDWHKENAEKYLDLLEGKMYHRDKLRERFKLLLLKVYELRPDLKPQHNDCLEQDRAGNPL